MRIKYKALTLLTSLALVACGNPDVESDADAEVDVPKGKPPSVTFTPAGDAPATSTPVGPVSVSYRIIGKPVVGQPIAIDLNVVSTMGAQPVTVSYRINDATAMQLAVSQPESVSIALREDNSAGGRQQVTVIPMREGRLYLNVSASVETETGSMSTVTAIPIQVGDAPRELQEHGELETDESGEAIRVLPVDSD